MKVVHVSTYDVVGGAARAAYRVHALRAAGVDSRMLVRESRSGDPHVDVFRPARDWVSRVGRRVRRLRTTRSLARYDHSRPPGYEPSSTDHGENGAEIARQVAGAGTVINLHWVANFVDYETFFPAVASQSPIVWTLHRHERLHGRVLRPAVRTLRGRSGPVLSSASRDDTDLSRGVWRRRQALLARQPRLHIVVAPSRVAEGRSRARQRSSDTRLST